MRDLVHVTSPALIPWWISLKICKSLLSSQLWPLIFSSSVITNTEEWRYFKALTRTPTPLEENMFHSEQGAPGPRVYLRPKESLHVPLKYQSFLCDHTMALQVWCRIKVHSHSMFYKVWTCSVRKNHILGLVTISGCRMLDKIRYFFFNQLFFLSPLNV